jgi:hypothetical protein
MNAQAKPLTEITQQAIELLTKEMGLVATVRFLNQFSSGYGDYTEERGELFDGVTLDQLLSAIKKDKREA